MPSIARGPRTRGTLVVIALATVRCSGTAPADAGGADGLDAIADALRGDSRDEPFTVDTSPSDATDRDTGAVRDGGDAPVADSEPTDASDTGSVPVSPVGPAGSWTLVFDDEFDGTSLDLTRWDPHWYSEGGMMNGVGTYAANVAVAGGNLVLTLASPTSGALINTQSNNGFAVEVGMYAEARVSFPGSGTSIYNWPAWWISGAPWPGAGEHDIAEGLDELTVNYHSPSGAHNHGAVPGTWSNAFHVYGIHRRATAADVYWDGTLVMTYPTDDNGAGENLILNVGAGNTAALGAESQVRVDYVRVWR